jgi:hypothetical protein
MIKNWGAAWAFLALFGLAAFASLREFSVPHNYHHNTADQSDHAAKNEDSTGDKIASALVSVAQFVDFHNGTVSALAGVVVAIFTFILAWKTWGLHVATRGLQDLAAIQSADMKESLRIASVAANAVAEAGKKSADAARLTLISTQRAWLTVKVAIAKDIGIVFDTNGAVLPIRIDIRNIENIPAIKVFWHA